MQTSSLPVVVLGAGPVGLAAAAHLLRRNLPVRVLEAGTDIAANVRSFGHVRLFSPWRYDVDHAAAALLEAHGWKAPDPEAFPTGNELVAEYLRPLAALPEMAAVLELDARVVAVTRLHTDKVRTAARGEVPFVVRVRAGDGTEREVLARAVLDATGTWATPNPLGADGLPAMGEGALSEHIVYGIPDVLGEARARFAGRHTLVVGAGHSAANTILDLLSLASEAPGTRVTWATRGGNLARVFGGGDADGLPERGKLGARLREAVNAGQLAFVQDLRIRAVLREGSALVVRGVRSGEAYGVTVDQVVAATGQRPDLAITRELRVEHDPSIESVRALAPLIDPNEHSCGSVRPHGEAELRQPEPGFYVLGVKSYGRAPTFLLATGYEQARSVVAYLDGDLDAAARVELDLPETGVCSSEPAASGSACCAPAPAVKPSACCPPAEKPTQKCC
jgi:thioredoxin reductase